MFSHERLLVFFPKEIEIPETLITKFHSDALHSHSFGYLMLVA